MANLPLAFAELLAGGIILSAATLDPEGSVRNVIAGKDHGFAPLTGSSGGPASGPAGSPSGGNLGGSYKNPFPGATASRVDQGVDYTSKQFLAPGDSKILISDQTNPGWAGGGYIAGRFLNGPLAGKVWYMAEGLAPLVSVGETVAAGTELARPVSNPYNGVIGNIEAGWASASAPGLPLAKSTGGYSEGESTAAGASFNRFVQSLGGPLGHLVSHIVGSLSGAGLP